MKRKWKPVLVLLLLGGLGVALWQRSGTPEPMYEGRPLTDWLNHHVASSAARPPYGSPGWKKADEALRAIGTNAIPTLVEMLRAKDPSRLVLNFLELAGRYRWTRIHYRYARPRHEEAEYAFEILGTNGVAAVADLVEIYEKNISPSSQRSAALSLGHIGRGATAAVPVLHRNFQHPDRDVRFYAVSAVMKIGGDPAVVVPMLMSVLQDENVSVRWNALSGLERFGRRARPAVPEIIKMLTDPGMVGGSSITQQVEVALWRIAPEQVGHPLVVEENSALVKDGKTVQALKMLFYGKHQTLIPPDKEIPTLGQYWNSDPRQGLTVYRGPAGSTEEDELLGRFEVVGLPDSDTNPNVSTLCIIADGRIILSARDNTQGKFLAIRRVESSGGP